VGVPAVEPRLLPIQTTTKSPVANAGRFTVQVVDAVVTCVTLAVPAVMPVPPPVPGVVTFATLDLVDSGLPVATAVTA
jgi:hypothetical protein